MVTPPRSVKNRIAGKGGGFGLPRSSLGLGGGGGSAASFAAVEGSGESKWGGKAPFAAVEGSGESKWGGKASSAEGGGGGGAAAAVYNYPIAPGGAGRKRKHTYENEEDKESIIFPRPKASRQTNAPVGGARHKTRRSRDKIRHHSTRRGRKRKD